MSVISQTRIFDVLVGCSHYYSEQENKKTHSNMYFIIGVCYLHFSDTYYKKIPSQMNTQACFHEP